MTKTNPHWGTSLDAFLSEEGIPGDAKVDAAGQVAAWRKDEIRKKIAVGMASLRAGKDTDGEAFMASMDDELAELERRGKM
jgi:hypothetical protein